MPDWRRRRPAWPGVASGGSRSGSPDVPGGARAAERSYSGVVGSKLGQVDEVPSADPRLCALSLALGTGESDTRPAVGLALPERKERAADSADIAAPESPDVVRMGPYRPAEASTAGDLVPGKP